LIKELAEVPAVLGNDGRLAQVFLNLLVNAAHAIEEGDIRNNVVRVRTWSDAAWVHAEVSDTGAGIAKEMLDSVFDPYVSTWSGSGRTGLGLALSKQVIEDYGGTITVDSEPGKGARFTVSLPHRAPAPTKPASPPKGQANTPMGGRILIIDDEDGIRDSLRRMLGDYEVIEASDGTIARAILENDQRFDVILCDMMMPDLSGMELHAWLRVASPEVAKRVIFITGGAFTPRGREYLIATGVPCLKKPFERKELKKVIADAIQRQPQV
jgi:CheY-like chemotaxis protein